MKSIKEYLKSVRFSLGYAFRFVPKESFLMVVIVIITGVLPYGSSYLLGRLVDTIIAGVNSNSYTNLYYLLILYALFNSLPTILGNLRLYIDRHWRLKLSTEVELSILERRSQIDIATLENPKFQDLVQRAFRNSHFPIIQLADGQRDIMQSIVSLIFGTILAIHFDLVVYLVVILSAIPSFIVDIKYASKVWGIWAKDSPAQRKYADLRQHIMSRYYLVETKLLQAGNKIVGGIRKILSDFTNVQLNTEKSKLWYTTISDAFAFVGFAIGLFLVVKNVVGGEIKVGSIVYMLGTLSNVRSSISFLLATISLQFDNHLIVKDIQEVMETKSVIIESKNPQKLDLTTPPEIVFENVSFKYAHAETWSLRNVSLTLRAGDNIGLVGNNGAGKTTLVKLLCRIYEPTEGRILINGVDLREVATAEWWSYLAVMFQDYASYDFVTKDAIAIGRPDKATNLTKVVEAAHTSQAHTFIEEWKEKYDQQLGVEFGGKEPSKGQRQKLSIAKILYRNGLVMVFDEPTASVDAESEAKIFDSIESLSKQTTALLISHDFSTISECDKIFVLDKGKLIEEGNHKDLMKNKGMYCDLYNLQAKRFKK